MPKETESINPDSMGTGVPTAFKSAVYYETLARGFRALARLPEENADGAGRKLSPEFHQEMAGTYANLAKQIKGEFNLG